MAISASKGGAFHRGHPVGFEEGVEIDNQIAAETKEKVSVAVEEAQAVFETAEELSPSVRCLFVAAEVIRQFVALPEMVRWDVPEGAARGSLADVYGAKVVLQEVALADVPTIREIVIQSGLNPEVLTVNEAEQTVCIRSRP